MTWILVGIGLWLFFAILCAAVAVDQKRNWLMWLVLGLLGGHLTLIIMIATGDKRV